MATEIDTVALIQYYEDGKPYKSIDQPGGLKTYNEAHVSTGDKWSFRFGEWGYRAFSGSKQEEPALDMRIEDNMDDNLEPHSMVTVDGTQQRLTANTYGQEEVGELFGEKARRQIIEIIVYQEASEKE